MYSKIQTKEQYFLFTITVATAAQRLFYLVEHHFALLGRKKTQNQYTDRSERDKARDRNRSQPARRILILLQRLLFWLPPSQLSKSKATVAAPVSSFRLFSARFA